MTNGLTLLLTNPDLCRGADQDIEHIFTGLLISALIEALQLSILTKLCLYIVGNAQLLWKTSPVSMVSNYIK